MSPRAGRLVMLVAAALLVAGCGDDSPRAAAPLAREPTRDDIGHYCNMIVVDHAGPKAQIFLSDRSEPLWFSSVRDAFAFTMLDEEPKNVTAIWVNDAGAITWARPEPGTWIKAREAWFVIGSDARGGMGALETVPFASREAADAFAHHRGGEVLTLSAVPRDYVLASVEPEPNLAGSRSPHHGAGHAAAQEKTQ